MDMVYVAKDRKKLNPIGLSIILATIAAGNVLSLSFCLPKASDDHQAFAMIRNVPFIIIADNRMVLISSDFDT